MKLTRQVIVNNMERFGDFQYYIDLHVVKIEENLAVYPDIAIEACKSLIEGVSKSILLRVDPTFDEEKATTGRNPKSVQQLFKMALEKVEELSEGFESGYIHSSGHIINMTQSMRTARGDISHGKSVPKQLSSTPVFAKLLADMTDLTIGYVLEHFFELEIDYRDRMRYDAKDYVEYNTWLDGTVEDFPIKTVSYSLLLHEHDYEAYEYLHRNDYRAFLDIDKEEEEADVPIAPEIDSPPETPVTGAPAPAEEEPARPKPVAETAPEGDIVPWTEEQEVALVAFVEDMGLKLPYARRVVQQYLFDGLRPLSDTVVETLVERPRLLARREIVVATTERLLAFANHIKPEAAPGGGVGE